MIIEKTKTKYAFEYFDEEDEGLYNYIESDDYIHPESLLTPERKAELQTMAAETLKQMRKKISIRIANHDLEKIKARAAKEGIPYQTLINSILHQAVSK